VPSKENVTRVAHVEQLLADAAAAIAEAEAAVVGRRLRPAQRDAISRRLAGVIGGCESVRLWLAAGAPL
jgi:uncharacterized protein (DUF2147 family)